MLAYGEEKKKIRRRILEDMDYSRDMSDEEIMEWVEEAVLGDPEIGLWSIPDKRRLARELFDSLRRLDILQMFVENPSITEIMINGRDHIFVEKEGRLSRLDLSFESEERLEDVIQQIVAGCNRVVNEASPIVDARLEGGARVNVVMKPVALNGPIVTIRRFPDRPITAGELIRRGSVSEEAMNLLRSLVIAGYNIFISGGTGSGKTTFLNVLSGFIPPDERIVTIEDSAELQIQGIPNLVRLETRNDNVEGCRPITIRDLIRTSLRMRPDRIVVGEVRGAEAADMLQCLNTGHDGSMSTGHANSCEDMLYRLETMVLMGMEIPISAIRQQIASGIDIIVHLGRMRDGTRKVMEIAEIAGCEDKVKLNVLFRFREWDGKEGGKGALVREGRLLHEEKLKAAGMDREMDEGTKGQEKQLGGDCP